MRLPIIRIECNGTTVLLADAVLRKQADATTAESTPGVALVLVRGDAIMRCIMSAEECEELEAALKEVRGWLTIQPVAEV